MTSTSPPPAPPARAARGRPRVLRPAAIQRVAMDLFTTTGYARTSVDDIAEALGVGRTTFFRYFRTKSAVIWHDYVGNRERLAVALAQAPAERSALDAVGHAITTSVRYDDDDRLLVRQRVALLASTPELARDGDAVGALWARTVADHLRRWHPEAEPARADILGYAYLGVLSAAMRRWSEGAEPWDAVLVDVLRTARHALVDPADLAG